jgi:hypothetical protein
MTRWGHLILMMMRQINYRQSNRQSENAYTSVDHPLRNHAYWVEQAAEMDVVNEVESQQQSEVLCHNNDSIEYYNYTDIV